MYKSLVFGEEFWLILLIILKSLTLRFVLIEITKVVKPEGGDPILLGNIVYMSTYSTNPKPTLLRVSRHVVAN